MSAAYEKGAGMELRCHLFIRALIFMLVLCLWALHEYNQARQDPTRLAGKGGSHAGVKAGARGGGRVTSPAPFGGQCAASAKLSLSREY